MLGLGFRSGFGLGFRVEDRVEAAMFGVKNGVRSDHGSMWLRAVGV